VLAAEPLDIERVHRVLDQVNTSQVTLDIPGLTLTFERALVRTAVQLWQNPDDLRSLQTLEDLAHVAESITKDVDLWKVQNIYFDLMADHYPRKLRAADRGAADAASWVASFTRLADRLGVSISQ
jgi:hypothetical protein